MTYAAREGYLAAVCLTAFLLVFQGCRQPETVEDNTAAASELYSWTAREKDILYHMSLPAQMTRIFENPGFAFQPELPNDPDHIGAYNTPFRIAANLGVYGADLGYASIMDQDLETAKLLRVIYTLSGQLSLPRDIFEDMLNNLDSFMDDPDELALQLDLIFHRANRYLKQSERDHLTAAILLGGWIESLYLASRVYLLSADNYDLLERIAEQKYSLNFLINHLNNFHDHEQLLQYNLMLKNLKRTYEQINIYYFEGDVSVDTITKTITAREYQIETSRNTILEIAAKVSTIRNRLVD